MKGRYISKFQFMRFALVGALSFSAYAGLLAFLIYLGLDASLAGFMSYFLLFFFNYLLQKKWTFKADTHHKIAFPKFCLCHILAALLNSLVLYIGLHVFGTSLVIAQLEALAAILAWNYFFQKLFVFST